MSERARKKQFLKFPEYPGGKLAYQRYILDNMIYPEEALKNRMEGTVFCSAEVDDNGKVFNIIVDKGLGYGCDEEAVRLLKGMHFGGVTNRGIRMKTRKRFRIPFRLQEPSGAGGQRKRKAGKTMQINYNYKPAEKTAEKKNSGQEQSQSGGREQSSEHRYTYTIRYQG